MTRYKKECEKGFDKYPRKVGKEERRSPEQSVRCPFGKREEKRGPVKGPQQIPR